MTATEPEAKMTANSHEKNEPPAARPDSAYQTTVRTMIVAGAFSALVSALLLADYARRRAEDPSEDRQYQALKVALGKEPTDDGLKTEIRQLDLRLREEYSRGRRFAASGAWLLLGGIVVFLIAAKCASTMRRKLPMPHPQVTAEDRETPTMAIARWSVGALVVVLLGTVFALEMSCRTELASLPEPEEPETKPEQPVRPLPEPRPKQPVAPAPQPPVQPPKPRGTSSDADYPPSDEEIRTNWPRFRGPGGLGISVYDSVPTSWDGASGEGIVWKTPVPLPGNNSPVVWDDRVFLSGADESRRELYCFDAADGKLLWQTEVPTTLAEPLDPEEVDSSVGLAASTTATDGRHVFAMFTNGDVGAVDFTGELAWARSLGLPDSSYGHASSLSVYRNMLLIQFDQGDSGKRGKSKLLALDTSTGETVYEVPRPVPNSWTTPIVLHHAGRDQLITCADPWLIAYDPADGSEIWRAECLSGDCGPSAVAVGGVVYVGNEYCVITAIRADGKGNVTDTEQMLWTAEDGLPDTCCPLATSEYLFLLATWGMLTCFDAKTGDLLWEKEFDVDGFTSSPGWAAGRVYLFSDGGKGWVIEPAREEGAVKVIAENDLGEECVTSPAFQDGRIYIRGKEHLISIGEQEYAS
jgi:outer membrane protein assembly factor BamB